MGDGIGDLAFWIAVAVMGAAFWGAVTPLFKAWGDRIRGGGGGHVAELERRLEALEGARPVTGETDAVYRRMAELEERLEFAERLLAQGRKEPDRIGGAS